MANLYEDIQSAGSDTRPPMLDRSDFESWQQRIRLYCLGKENGENILQSTSIDGQCPFKMGKFRATLAEGALHLGPERDRVFAGPYTRRKGENKGETINEYYVRFTKLINDMRNIKMAMPKMQLNSKFVNNMLPEWGLTPTDDLIENLTKTVALLSQSYKTHLPQTKNQLKTSSNTKNQATVQNGRVVVQNVQGRQNRVQGNNARGVVVAGNAGVLNSVGNANPGQAKPIKCYNFNGIWYIARQCTHQKQTSQFRILQGQDATDTSSGE
ncbi:hypothetical protein Tco_0890385 [Tanacetum coccineum]|uniref:Integrase, catalytic region, zinc finger, CCHC-type, peptidase aspartic, catalytic n=1 Tax=Tanacetum coccineum TaxID=301880 RepID=A0ABQ5C3D3_9ASTR